MESHVQRLSSLASAWCLLSVRPSHVVVLWNAVGRVTCGAREDNHFDSNRSEDRQGSASRVAIIPTSGFCTFCFADGVL